jgi:hypothetical protein
VYQAVLISYAELCCKVVLEKCDLLQLLDVVTPPTYEKLEGEMVLSIEFNQLLSVVENISSRMADACLSAKTTMIFSISCMSMLVILNQFSWFRSR